MPRTSTKPACPAYNQSEPYIGFGGVRHDSKTEAKVSFFLAQWGIYSTKDAFFDGYYTEPGGQQLRAKPDYIHAASGYRFEFKCADLNRHKTKAAADEAFGAYWSAPWRVKGNEAHNQLTNGWNHSAWKLSTVQEWQGIPNFALLLAKAPSASQARLFAEAGIFWITLKDVPTFSAYLKLRDIPGIGYRQGFYQLGAESIQSPTIQLECRPEVMDGELKNLKLEGYRLKKGSTATNAVLTLKKPSASPALH